MSIRKSISKRKISKSRPKQQRRISKANSIKNEIDAVERNVLAIQSDTTSQERSKLSHDIYRLQDKTVGKLNDRVYLLSEKLRHETPVMEWVTENYIIDEPLLELIRTGNVEIDLTHTPEHGGELYLPYVKSVRQINSIKKNMTGLNGKSIDPTDDSSPTAINVNPHDLDVGKLYEFHGAYNDSIGKHYKLLIEKNIDEHGRTQFGFLNVGNSKYDAMDVMKHDDKNQRLVDVNREIDTLRFQKKQLSIRTKRFRSRDNELYRKGGGLAVLAFVGTPTKLNEQLKKLTEEKKDLMEIKK